MKSLTNEELLDYWPVIGLSADTRNQEKSPECGVLFSVLSSLPLSVIPGAASNGVFVELCSVF